MPSKYTDARFLNDIELALWQIETAEPAVVVALVNSLTHPRLVGKPKLFTADDNVIDDEVIGRFDRAMAAAPDSKARAAWQGIRDGFLRMKDGTFTPGKAVPMLRERIATIRAASAAPMPSASTPAKQSKNSRMNQLLSDLLSEDGFLADIAAVESFDAQDDSVNAQRIRGKYMPTAIATRFSKSEGLKFGRSAVEKSKAYSEICKRLGIA